MNLKKIIASILSLTILIGFSVTPSSAYNKEDINKIALEAYGKAEKSIFDSWPNNMPYEMKAFLKKYPELKKSDKEKFNKIFMEIRKQEIKERFLPKIKKTLYDFFILCLSAGFFGLLFYYMPVPND